MFDSRQRAIVFLVGLTAWWVLWGLSVILEFSEHGAASEFAFFLGAPACLAAVLPVSRDWRPTSERAGFGAAMRRGLDLTGQISEAVNLSGWPRRTVFGGLGVLAFLDAVLLVLIFTK